MTLLTAIFYGPNPYCVFLSADVAGSDDPENPFFRVHKLCNRRIEPFDDGKRFHPTQLAYIMWTQSIDDRATFNHLVPLVRYDHSINYVAYAVDQNYFCFMRGNLIFAGLNQFLERMICSSIRKQLSIGRNKN